MEAESRELAEFEDWLATIVGTATDEFVRVDSYSALRTGNLLNRLSLSNSDDMIIELVRVRWMKSHYNHLYDKGTPWSRILRKVPFPYERTFEPEPPSENWRYKILDYVSRHHNEEILRKEDLLAWGIDEKHLSSSYNEFQSMAEIAAAE